MSMRYPGGFITATAPTVNASSAKGIWTIEEAMQYVKAGQWPVPTGNGDPYFGLNTLLLPGQGTNGAQNNTFLDSSTNNFTITRNGNTTQGTFTPFSHASGYWSNYYNSTLTGWSEVLWTELSGISWTCEFWFYPIAQGGVNGGMIFGNNLSGRADACFIYHGSDGKVGITTAGGSNFTYFASATSLPLNQWTHVAITISGSSGSATGKIYLNGVLSTTQSSMNTVINSMSLALTGSRGDGSQYNLYGYLSNFRIVKNQILYTGDFTPATAPLTTTSVGTSGANVAASITGTVSTLIYNNAYLTNSGATSATVINSATGQTFSPFGAPTSAYSAATNGGSGYFDGSGDNLAVSQSAFVATGDFTIEAWFYQANQTSGYQGILSASGNGGSTGFRITTDVNTLVFWLNSSTVGSASIPQNVWHHVAISRTGSGSNNVSCYLNGVRVGQITNTGSTTNSSLVVGQYYNDLANYYFQGYVSGLRLIVGSGIYSGSTISIPTSPPTAITNTALLLNFTNAGVIDNAVSNNLETVGGAQISTSQYKWGTSSVYFDGGGDYLIQKDTPNLTLETGDFTIEMWLYRSVSGAQHDIIAFNPTSTNGAYPALYISSGNVLFYYTQSANQITGPTINTGQWYHVALSRSSGSTKLFVDGNQVGSTYADTNSYLCGTNRPIIGSGGFTVSGTYNGYIADLRITKGLGRYQYNFTAPTAAFPLFYQAAAIPSSDPYFSNVTLLLPGNGTNGANNNTFLDSSTNNFTITRNGNTTQGTFTPFSRPPGYWSTSFDGNGDYLSVPWNATAFDFGTGNFTMEAWVYVPAMVGDITMWTTYDYLGAPGEYGGFFNISSTGSVIFGQFSGGGNVQTATSSAGVVRTNQWVHLAAVRSSTTLTLYANGSSVATNTSFTHPVSYASSQFVMANNDGVYTTPVIMSNLRIVKGVAVYTGTFTPPTTPLAATQSSGTNIAAITGTQTSLLLEQSSRYVDNSTYAATVTVGGNPAITPFSPFSVTTSPYSTTTVGGSGYFDGTGDYLSSPIDAAFQFGTGDFTIESWWYPTTISSTYQSIAGVWTTSQYGWLLQVRSTDVLIAVGGGSFTVVGSATIAANQWHHVAATRSGTTVRVFLNGVLLNSGTSSASATASTPLQIARNEDGNQQYVNGYLSGTRLVKGGALYTATFTPPTSPPTTTVSSGTVSLLLNYTNAGIIDNAMSNDLETVGNAQISTTQSKFGGSSMYFDGTGDWLLSLAGDRFAFGTGDYTVEAWIYLTSVTTTDLQIIFMSGSTGGNNFYFHVDGNQISVGTSAAFISNQTTSFTINTWYHIAACRYGTILKLFVNGMQAGSNATDSTNWISSGFARVGSNESGAQTFFGYIDDLRITKGIARYVQNFTPPTQAFPLL